MRIRPLKFEIILDEDRRLDIGSVDELDSKAEAINLPRREYILSAPMIGFVKMVLGKKTERHIYEAELKILLPCLLNNELAFDMKVVRIQKSLQIYEVAYSVIYQFYINLRARNAPWHENEARVLSENKKIFLSLVENGATWEHIENQNLDIFLSLVKHVYGPELLGSMLADIKFESSESHYKRMDFFLELGADINSISSLDPNSGTFLHHYVANELIGSVEMIDWIESKRNPGYPNRCFNYCTQDGMGKTILLLAAITRQEKTVIKLLKLQQRGIDVGINIPDVQGRTPLMICAALGMKTTVELLLKLNVNVLAEDNCHATFREYVDYNEIELRNLLSSVCDPDRGSEMQHSYLYYNDAFHSPVCCYEKNKQEECGDGQKPHLVVLSPLPDHLQRLTKIMQLVKANNSEESIALFLYLQDQVNLIGNKTLLQACREGQEQVQKFLASSKAQQAIKLSKECWLRSACALGNIDMIERLLAEGINPNATDDLKRTALHYAVMRFQLVKNELIKEKTSVGDGSSVDESQVLDCLTKHSAVIECLVHNSKEKINFKAINKANNTAEDILKRLAMNNPTNPIDEKDSQAAKICLALLEKFIKKDDEQKTEILPLRGRYSNSAN